MMKYTKAKTAKLPATFIQVYINVIADYIANCNYGMAKELAMELKQRLDEIDWKSYKKWLDCKK